MKSLLIIGAGGYGRLVKDIAKICGYGKIDFIDDNYSDAVGSNADLDIIKNKYEGSIVAIGNPDVREQISDKLGNLVTIVHPSAFISPTAHIEAGCVIEANAVVSAHSLVGKSSYVCAGAVVNHDAVIHNCCQIDCNAVVASGATVPDKTKVMSCSVWNKNEEKNC